jgi:2',3'-cyclic-nucleotide 2'-phosphodiesterase (5'-nucleotidase family)
MKLLSEVPDVDVLLSGHTHHRLFEPVRQGKTLIIQSGRHGSFLGRLDLEIRDGRVVDHRHELIEVSEGIAPDPKIEAMVKEVLKPYAEDLGCVVGEVSTALDRSANIESTMDNFSCKRFEKKRARRSPSVMDGPGAHRLKPVQSRRTTSATSFPGRNPSARWN